MTKKKAYGPVTKKRRKELLAKQKAREHTTKYSDYRPIGRNTWFDKGQFFGSIPQQWRRGFTEIHGKPKTKKARSEFRWGMLLGFKDFPLNKPKKKGR